VTSSWSFIRQLLQWCTVQQTLDYKNISLPRKMQTRQPYLFKSLERKKQYYVCHKALQATCFCTRCCSYVPAVTHKPIHYNHSTYLCWHFQRAATHANIQFDGSRSPYCNAVCGSHTAARPVFLICIPTCT